MDALLADGEAPWSAVRTMSDADARVAHERLHEVGIGRLDLLERQALVADVEVDEREVATGDDDEVGGSLLPALPPARRSAPLGRELGRRARARPAVLAAVTGHGAGERAAHALRSAETSPRNVLSWPQSSTRAVAAATEAWPPMSERTTSWRVTP